MGVSFFWLVLVVIGEQKKVIHIVHGDSLSPLSCFHAQARWGEKRVLASAVIAYMERSRQPSPAPMGVEIPMKASVHTVHSPYYEYD
jgi:hypothetical protein